MQMIDDSWFNEWLRCKRENPYYYTMGTLFAVVLGALATWLYTISKRPMETYWPIPILLLMFLMTIYAWLYFSRILIYVNETPIGELFSFSLAFSIVASVAIAASQEPSAIMKTWPLFLLPPMFVWIGKCGQLLLSLWLRERQNPLWDRGYAVKWTIKATVAWIVTVAIAANAYGSYSFVQTQYGSGWADAAGMTVVMAVAAVLLTSIHGMEKYENTIKQAMKGYLKPANDQEVTIGDAV